MNKICQVFFPLLRTVTGVTILLSLTVFLNLVAETLPQVSDAIPLLGIDTFSVGLFPLYSLFIFFLCLTLDLIFIYNENIGFSRNFNFFLFSTLHLYCVA